MAAASSAFILRVPHDVASLLRKLHPKIKSQIKSGLRAIIADPWCGKPLKEEFRGLRSYRVKRYRIIYRIQTKRRHLEIVAVGPRKIIYEETFRLISKEL